MKKLIISLIFLIFISPNVWGNEINFLNNNYSGFLIDDNYRICLKSSSSLQLNLSISLVSEKNNYCNKYSSYSSSNIMVNFELKKRDPNSRFTVSFQGGINLGFQNKKRRDGSVRLKFRANIKGDYDWKILKGDYKIFARILKPADILHQNYDYFLQINTMSRYNYSRIDNERIPYIGIELSF